MARRALLAPVRLDPVAHVAAQVVRARVVPVASPVRVLAVVPVGHVLVASVVRVRAVVQVLVVPVAPVRVAPVAVPVRPVLASVLPVVAVDQTRSGVRRARARGVVAATKKR